MVAINSSLLARDAVHQLAKRRNWAANNPGVTLVFAIVGVVGISLISLWIYKIIQKRKKEKPAY